ncbi:MAG: SDR family oxidoreductase [bacterium]
MRILVTGTSGYIGSVMAPYLISKGHEVVGLDTGYYLDGLLYQPEQLYETKIVKDIRQVQVDDLQGFDACVHLSELSNDALGRLDRAMTFKINHQGSARLARLCKEAGVSRFIYSSSCSVYGIAAEALVSEESQTNPQTAYAECKTLVEKELEEMADEDFSPTMMRNGTAYGASPRMRFDIVVNNLSGLAWTTNEIRMTSDGTPWRPLVHVRDICKAFAQTLEAPREKVHNQIFNVGDTEENYRVRQVAQIIAEVFSGSKLTFGSSDGDDRSYKVTFDKIQRVLPDFQCTWNVEKGAQELREVFERIKLSDKDFEFRAYTRLKQLEYLLQTEQIDQDYYWRKT